MRLAVTENRHAVHILKNTLKKESEKSKNKDLYLKNLAIRGIYR